MTLSQLSQAVSAELDRRNLKNPQIRKNALSKVCDFISSHASEYLLNGNIHLPSDKEDFNDAYKSHKGGDGLSGAESSIINEIYNQMK